MRLLITGATGFLGWRTTTLLRERGHDVLAVARPGHAPRTVSARLDVLEVDAGDPAISQLVVGRDAVLHFAGVPDPASAAADPARAVRENAGTTLNLLEGCRAHGAGLVYPSTVRAGIVPAPDPYAASKRLGEEACGIHAAKATVVRFTSVFGPGQVRWEGATGAIAAFAARALAREPIVIPGNPRRTRDFVYVDDVVEGLETIVRQGRWNEVLTAGSGAATSLVDAAALVVQAVGTAVPVKTPGGTLPAAEDASYAVDPRAPRVPFNPRPPAETVPLYVDWLQRHAAAQGRA